MSTDDDRERSEGEPDPDGGPLRELGALYRGLQPPPLADGASAADPRTARVVQWMQSAWRGLEVPPARVPELPRRAPQGLRALRGPARLALLGAAAALLVLGGAALWRALRHVDEPARAPRVAENPDNAAGGGDKESEVEVLAALPDRLELRSGPVRLVLLEPPPTEPDTQTIEPRLGG